jgi:hypothetical protein
MSKTRKKIDIDHWFRVTQGYEYRTIVIFTTKLFDQLKMLFLMFVIPYILVTHVLF